MDLKNHRFCNPIAGYTPGYVLQRNKFYNGWTCDAQSQGPAGEKGPVGAHGLNGEKGDTGATGLKGDKGPKGDIGATGLKGDISCWPA